MNDEQIPALEVGDEDVTEQEAAQEADTTDDEAEGQEDSQPAEDAEESEESKDSPSKQRRERRKAEMERLRQSERQANEELEALKERLQKIEDSAKKLQPPKESDFQDYNEYLMSLAAYRTTAAMDERQRSEIQESAEAQRKKVEDLRNQQNHEISLTWGAQVEDAKDRYADFERVAFSGAVPINDAMTRLIMTSDVGADVAYYLGKNKAEAAKIAQMSEIEAARAIGGIEARMAGPKPRLKSNAPDPVTPVKPKAAASKDPDKMTVEEWRAFRNAGGMP